jgi:SAM-dependent methyltransferase
MEMSTILSVAPEFRIAMATSSSVGGLAPVSTFTRLLLCVLSWKRTGLAIRLATSENGYNMPAQPSDSRYNDYLRHVQYATPDNLNARILLHAKYATSSVSWWEWLHRQIEWTGVHDALDVGCGTGAFWSSLPQTLDEVRLVLVDLSRAMLELAAGAADQRVARVNGVEANVQTLPFDDESFDVVVANQMLYHATDPDQAAKEIRRVLRPHGTLMASSIGPAHLHELFDIEQSIFEVPRQRILGDIFGPVSGLAVLQQHFGSSEWRSFDDGLRCTNVDDVVSYMTSTPPGDRATPVQLVKLREETQRRMDAGDGVLTVTKETGVFLARCV